ncbi:hypothetical protein ACIBO5_44670 [Nonomuraea angiospora]|uniref:hypothetical protein n=1 Tax=Nonomuraea angiospora TaxID=46172 RepID=UPI0037B774BA
MAHLMCRVVLAATFTSAGLAVPGVAHAGQRDAFCPDSSICDWMRSHNGGAPAVVYEEWEAAGFIYPPVSTVQNRTDEPRCFYEQPMFSRRQRRVNFGEMVESLGFRAESAHRTG